METIAKRTKRPLLSGTGEQVLAQYEQRLRTEEDLSSVTIRNYLSDLRHFAAWCEAIWKQGQEEERSFTPEAITTPTLTDYRTYLQQALHLKPNSVNRSLISLKRYFSWLLTRGQIRQDPAKVVKLVGEEVSAPRYLDDQEEQALVAAVTEAGNLRDRAIIVLLLHTGLRARELCTLTRAQVQLGRRSGSIVVQGKHNKYREVPLNATARAALLAYDPSLKKTVRAKNAGEPPPPSVLLTRRDRPGVCGGSESASVAHGGRRSSPVAARATECGRAGQCAARAVGDGRHLAPTRPHTPRSARSAADTRSSFCDH